MFTGHFRSYLSTGRTYITKTSLPRYCLRIYTQTAIDISALIANQIQLCQICQISRATLRSCALGNNEYAQETYIKRLDGSQSLTNSRSHTTYFVQVYYFKYPTFEIHIFHCVAPKFEIAALFQILSQHCCLS